MQPLSPLLQPQVAGHTALNPLMQSVVGEELYTLRLFNIISDLAIVKSWMSDPEKRTNWELPPDFPTIFRYYALLESPQAQSFMILQHKIQRVQLDLRHGAAGLSVDYLYTSQHRGPNHFGRALDLLNRYIDGFDPMQKRLLSVPTRSTDTVKEAAGAAFIQTDIISARPEITMIFP